MAQAIIRGLLAAGHDAKSIAVADPAESQQQALAAIDSEIRLSTDGTALAADSELLVLAVKPQIMPEVCQALSSVPRPTEQVIVSIAAGITLQSMTAWFGSDAGIVRVMPNQPALLAEGMSGLCATNNVSAAGKEQAGYAMAATGKLVWIDDESLMDAVTAVSGSGPAYFYLIMEIMQELAEEFGFDADTARLLSTQTALGAGRVAASSDEALASLRERVTSPGGTTAAALATLEAEGIRAMFRKALTAARDRSIELGTLDK